MEFLIADTFTESLARLTGEEQKLAKTTAFDLQMNPVNPGMSLHRLDRAKDKCFWSARVGSDIRLIIHRTENSMLLCYVAHHDKAYAWAERRRLQTHPRTGAAQFVEIRETIQEFLLPSQKTDDPVSFKESPLFADKQDEELLSYGVPSEWLGDVKRVTQTELLNLTDHLPAEASEALLELAIGGIPRKHQLTEPNVEQNPFKHPDAQRRFRVMANVEELQTALEFPWDKWTVFLHPEQRQWVIKDYSGPARVSGSAGTGKTIVAVHRAVHLARLHPNSRVLLTTFSETLANALHGKLRRLIGSEPRLGERIDVRSINMVGLRLYKAHCGPAKLVDKNTLNLLLSNAANAVSGHRFSQTFLRAEWEQVVDAWQLQDWEAYRDVARLGRKTRLSETQRKQLWAIFEIVRERLSKDELVTYAQLFTSIASALSQSKNHPFDFIVVDEAQDIGVAELRMLAAVGAGKPNSLFFAGDLGQRIFQQPFSWKALGVDIRGRSRTLRVNYRTSHQIRSQADRLLGATVTDIDGNVENRSDTVSVFNGPPPCIKTLKTLEEEAKTVGLWMKECIKLGVTPQEIGVIVRSSNQLNRAISAVSNASLPFKILDEKVITTAGHVTICTMDLAKGLEFRVVAVMACDDEVIPLQERIEAVGDETDLREVYDTERQLLYVACTRARDQLLITSVEPSSEFLVDMIALPNSASWK